MVVTIAERIHLFPSRTQKLSSLTPKVLGLDPGRIGSCHLQIWKSTSNEVLFLLLFGRKGAPFLRSGGKTLFGRVFALMMRSRTHAPESPLLTNPPPSVIIWNTRGLWASANFSCAFRGASLSTTRRTTSPAILFENERLCDACRAELPKIELCCPFCGRRVRESGVCLECKKQPLGVAKARSVFCHEEGAAALVLRFKRGEKYLVYTLADELTPLLEREFADCDALTFIPMTKRAERARGYNQSRLLAEELSRRTGKALLDVAEKRKAVPPAKKI